MTAEEMTRMARSLGRLGGQARAQSLSAKRRRAIASLGGQAARAGRSKALRQKIAREAAHARWGGIRAAKRIEENARRLVVIEDIRANFR